MLNHHQEALREVREDRNFILEVGYFIHWLSCKRSCMRVCIRT
jgi:hypothetical protein